jgi:DNA (cytosine-5)-methyltransferase 1
MPTLISLFSGAGGLDLGLEAAGFHPLACVEVDTDCQRTLRTNRSHWRIAEPSNIFDLDPADLLAQAGTQPGEVDLIAAGPPCQPFSKAGYWARGESLRLRDPRARTLAAFARVVDATLPMAILLENVDGIKFSKKDEGLRYLVRHLEKTNRKHGTRYTPVIFLINAAEYGVPQVRKRVFLVACRDGTHFAPPAPTHGSTRLPIVTAWDAIGHLNATDEDLQPTGSWTSLLATIPEGHNYQWHTDHGGGSPLFGFRTRYWSFLLKLDRTRPSWTIPAQPGPSTGPFHWDNRLLSIHEMARLQTFPDSYTFQGTRRSIQSQIGNAVPPLLAEVIGRELAVQLFGLQAGKEPVHSIAGNPPPRRQRRIKLQPVPQSFTQFAGSHAPHPGTGKGPGARLRKTTRNSR